MEAIRSVLIAGEKHPALRAVIDDLMAYGWSVQHANTLPEAASLMRQHSYPVGLLDLECIGSTGIDGTERILDNRVTHWVALADSTAMRRPGVSTLLARLFFSYHMAPVDTEKLNCLLEHALAMAQLPVEGSEGEYAGHNGSRQFQMIGSTPAMLRLYKTLRRVAAVDASVFISGESGTGKELTAHAIHTNSARAHGPFNVVNCGALPGNLIQSELFGHEKGAFTGAGQRKIGRIEHTQGGTLFLDEIGDLPLDMQVNLLRFLENHKIQRVGGLQEIAVDVRVLAATHENLEQAVAEGRFREDLYHRLNVLQVEIPALREREEDIDLLARFFFDKHIAEKATQVRGFHAESLTLMRQYHWPGNIRELINRVRRAMVMCEYRLIRPADLRLERRQFSSRHVATLEHARDAAEHDVVTSALARNSYRIQHAARDLGISRVTLYRLIEKHRIARNGGGLEQAPLLSAQRPAVVHLRSINENDRGALIFRKKAP